MKTNKKLTHQEYEYLVWRLTRTFSKLGYDISSPLKKGYSAYAYKYGVLGGKFK